MAAERCAVLLMAYGGPGNLDEVEPYLLDVRGGRPTSPELVEEIRGRYARIGGGSPIRRLTEAQAASLRRALGAELPVYVGMRHWHPYIAETVERLVAIALAPHYSVMSVGAYERKLAEAAAGRLDVVVVRRWGDHPTFLDAVAARLRDALARFPDPASVPVIFTAHSLPQRILASGDPYADEFRASVAAVVERLALARWHLAFQSAGATPEPWLGPDAGEVLQALAAEGGREALIAPIGFVCDHVEVLYDVDVEYRALAARLGMRLERTASLNDDPLLIACLADLARRAAADRGWR